MPSNSPTPDGPPGAGQGRLYVVATPIGNRDDITLRALKVLAAVDLVAAEDTRHTGRLLAAHAIKSRLVAYHQYNQDKLTPQLLSRLRGGESIAVVTDAGTPAVSDPGCFLVGEALKLNIPVVPIPGVSAAIAALSVAGLPTGTFTFIGFTAKKPGKRRNQLERLADLGQTLIFYESPRRLQTLISDLIAMMGDRQAVLAREMTKRHEEFVRGSLSDIQQALSERRAVRGECTLLVAGRGGQEKIPVQALRRELASRLADPAASLPAVVKELCERFDLPRNRVYTEALDVKQRSAGGNND